MNKYDKLFNRLAEYKKMEKKERKVVEEKIVERMLGDIKPTPWYKSWFYYRPKWWWVDFTFWVRCKKQRLTTGFAHNESWDFAHWHAKAVVPRLKWLRDNHIGYPVMDFDDNNRPTINSHSIGPLDNDLEGKEHFDL